MRKLGRLFCIAASMHAVLAQTGAPVQGIVRNRATGVGIAGASVTFFTQEAAAIKS
jgi:hypothetical protein